MFTLLLKQARRSQGGGSSSQVIWPGAPWCSAATAWLPDLSSGYAPVQCTERPRLFWQSQTRQTDRLMENESSPRWPAGSASGEWRHWRRNHPLYASAANYRRQRDTFLDLTLINSGRRQIPSCLRLPRHGRYMPLPYNIAHTYKRPHSRHSSAE